MQHTVKQLYEELGELIKAGHGDRALVISDDNEGNGYHGMFYSPSLGEELIESAAECGFPTDGIEGLYDSAVTDPKKLVVIG